MIHYLILEQVLEIHDEMLRLFGGLVGIRDINLLHSAIETPKLAVFGQELYPSVYDKAATYLYLITRNHPFTDGNKRTAYVSALVFLEGNNVKNKFKNDDLERIIIEVAKGGKDKESLAAFLEHGIDY